MLESCIVVKRVDSWLLENFLHHVESGAIAGKSNSSGVPRLESMVNAVKKVLAGADPDQALGITRNRGKEHDEELTKIAFAAHLARFPEAGPAIGWEAITAAANAYLESINRTGISRPRIYSIYKDRLPWIEEWLGMQRLRYHIFHNQGKSQFSQPPHDSWFLENVALKNTRGLFF